MLLVLTNLKSISQNLNDSSTSIPNSQLRLAINLIEKGKITQEELDSTKLLVDYLNKRIMKKDSLLFKYGEKDQLWKKIDNVNKEKITNLNSVVQNQNSIISIQSRTIKKQKKLGIAKLLFGAVLTLFIVK
jgi:hypothetical protein